MGNWTVSTDFSSDTTPVTIEPAPGAGNPVLDGGGTSGPDGPVLTVQANQFVALSGITITGGNNAPPPADNPNGGGLQNAGTVTITGSTFTGNGASDGGTIDSGDFFSGVGGGGGAVQVTASTFTGNTATDGPAIDSGDNTGAGTVQVAGDVFDSSCNQASGGTWTDGGYNAGDSTCFNGGPSTIMSRPCRRNWVPRPAAPPRKIGSS